MMLEQAVALKEQLTEFALDAEGDIAVALETYSLAQMSRGKQQNLGQQQVTIDRFLLECQIQNRPLIDWFQQEISDLTESDRQLLQLWSDRPSPSNSPCNIVGLFSIQTLEGDHMEVMNWLTAKHYLVQLTDAQRIKAEARLKPGEILLSQIVPLPDRTWMFWSEWVMLGKLGKPKLAVAIGNFKDTYPDHLYSDAPDLLAEAWRSVEHYHQAFIDFFGSDEITLPGWQLDKQLTDFQTFMTERLTTQSLQAAGLDPHQSLTELAEASGVDTEELAAAAAEMGAELGIDMNPDTAPEMAPEMAPAMSAELGSDAAGLKVESAIAQAVPKMMLPSLALKPQFKKAPQLTAISHPQWGQSLLTAYHLLQDFFAHPHTADSAPIEKLLLQYLEDPEIHVDLWHRLAQQHPVPLEALLQTVTDNPQFRLQDLDALLQSFGKPLTPQLPETASVPLHLHELFQEAVIELNAGSAKSKSKSNKGKGQKVSTGFQRS
ncbi:MAG: hypothetical protein MUF49_14750 [Oculatellaceae cyanobacterium Prado106]|jgi:hypothetical protein|nr:hypothetical protein [Oculatellaceae cyanobacterium Prado106]